MPKTVTDEQLRLAARLYYLDGLGQGEVARFVKVSQAKVSRWLSLARERGIVRISVAGDEPRSEDLEKRLKKKFGLSAAGVMRTVPGFNVEYARRAVGRFGAPFVGSLISPGSTVAIAGGRTMRELVASLSSEPGRHTNVLQAMGNIDSTVNPEDALELGRTLARRWGGRFQTMNTPALVPDRKTRDAFLLLPQIRNMYQRFGQADAALIGVGTLDNSIFVAHGVLNEVEREKLARLDAVGEICGRFYDAKGQECDSPWRDRVLSAGLEQLRHIPLVIAVVAGADRREAILAAIRGGIIKAIVTDDICAEALLKENGLNGKKRVAVT